MKEVDFSGFVIYKAYTNGNIIVNHVIKDNDYNAYRYAIETIYKEWNRKCDNVRDIFLLTLPCNKPYDIENPIFSGSSIGTEKEFKREDFQNEYYDERIL